MAKRFIGTDIWMQDWFLDMPNEYKLFWNYILCECDHAGFFKVNLRMFSALVEVKIDSKRALEFFNSDKQRIREIKDNLWFIEDFICFQYGSRLNSNNKMHKSVINMLLQYEVDLRSIRGLLEVNTEVKGDLKQDLKVGLKDKDKDKDKDIYSLTSNKKVDEKIYRSFDHLSISKSEVSKLKELGFSQESIDDILDAIQNNKNSKNYKSLFLTAKNWLKKDSIRTKGQDIFSQQQKTPVYDDKFYEEFRTGSNAPIYAGFEEQETDISGMASITKGI